ncbi:DCL family protein [Salinispora arenicola]|uniref:DCL family protein n=1 Tax=Salinispora arenicola TaxID=168697 RepID=UPI000380B30C|nr:DCL family protein [Salinispora arenicola]
MAKPLTIGARHFKTKKAAEDACRSILYGYPQGGIVTDPDHRQFLDDLLLRHHDPVGKIGCGILRYEVRQNPAYPSQTSFYLVRVDGTETDFSFIRCITPTNQRYSALEAMRQAIAPQVIAVVERTFAEQKTVTCALTGVPLISRQDAHVDHAQPTFLDLATAFAENVGGWDMVQVASGDGVIGTQMADDQQREAWCVFHAERANLRVVSIQANLSLLRRGQRRATDSAEDQA